MARTVAGFELVRELGRGTTAVVHLAERGGDATALKLFRTGEEAVARHERCVLAALRGNPGVVGLRGWGEDASGSPYLALEPATGTLASGVGSTERVAIGLLAALAAVHRVGVVHGDVKPANVLVLAGGQVVLADFGSSRLEGADPQGRTDGTPAHLAPELAAGGGPTVAGDLYAAGSTIRGLPGPPAPGALGAVLDDLLSPDPDRRLRRAGCLGAGWANR